jgi:hypothetical protein
MVQPRLPAALEIAALLRQTQAAGGFGMVLHKGDADSGAILVVALDRENLGTLYERLPDPAAPDAWPRRWQSVRRQDADSRPAFDEYLDRRVQRDPDLWIIELTIADAERSILNPP